jgi:hypothetical protein
VEEIDSDKHSSLLRHGINNVCKMFYSRGARRRGQEMGQKVEVETKDKWNGKIDSGHARSKLARTPSKIILHRHAFLCGY